MALKNYEILKSNTLSSGDKSAILNKQINQLTDSISRIIKESDKKYSDAMIKQSQLVDYLHGETIELKYKLDDYKMFYRHAEDSLKLLRQRVIIP